MTEAGAPPGPTTLAPRLGDRLIARSLLTHAQLEVALKEQKRTGEPLGRILVGLGFIAEEVLGAVLFDAEGSPFVSLREERPDPALLEACGEALLRRHPFVPIRREGNGLLVAMADPTDVLAVDGITRALGLPVRTVGAPREEIQAAVRAYLAGKGDRLDATIDGRGEDADAAVHFVEGLLSHAHEVGATDIHLEPEERLLRVRFRVDGLLVPAENVPADLALAVLSRVKLLAGADISEHRLPQDGRIRFEGRAGRVDLRVSVLPTIHGENIVLRLLDAAGTVPRLDRLGLPPRIAEACRAAAARPNGLFLASGPTGSGKTTTLFALLATLDAMQRKICTTEDPVEYRLPLVRQCQVRPEIGLTFAAALRALLRQDPDVLLVGEMRDLETAQIAVRAALTGHLVLSTLHTTSAVGSLPRLLDMGIEPFLLNSTILGVLAQRLVRLLCRACAVEEEPTPGEREWLGAGLPPGARLLHPRGCPACRGGGFRGRIGIYELFTPSAASAEIAARRGSARDLAREARARGMSTLLDDGRAKVLSGSTTMGEVLRVTVDAGEAD
ncbi:MAG TPA: GspE/PulE family protein [Planctomycetota bacterium]|jgi:type IV pilus assembly protein PilB|nr:GspE/PulE family protein [Planctomycetota bacterium]